MIQRGRRVIARGARGPQKPNLADEARGDCDMRNAGLLPQLQDISGYTDRPSCAGRQRELTFRRPLPTDLPGEPSGRRAVISD